MKMDINTAELTIDEKYIIKPLMTIEEIKNSNLKEIMDEKSKIQLEEDPTNPIFIKHIIDGKEVSIRLDITKKKLIGIYITVDPEGISGCYRADDKGRMGQINNIQIPQIEGINEVEYKKVKELCNMYGKFPNEDDFTESVKNLQNEVKSISDQINHFNQEKIKLESVEKAVNVIEDIYNKYESSGFDKNLLKENVDNIAKYEKVKEILKTTDIKNNVELRKRIEDHKNNIEKLEQTKNNLNMESNQISDSYNAFQKYKDIGTKKLNQLKKELLCNLKAKDEVMTIFIHNNDKTIQDFCEEKKKEIDMSVENLDKEINTIGIMDKSEIDDKIDYIKQKLADEKRYLQENNSLNDSHKENEIKEITKNAMEEINLSVYNKLNAINELYNIENKVAEVQKEIKLKEDVIQLQKEVKILETAKEKLEIMDKYKPIMAIMDESLNNELFKDSYENKYGAKIKEYNQAKNDLESMKINNWDKYKEAKSIYDEKEKSLLGDKNVSEVTSLDNIKEFEKIVKYKNKQNEIVKKNSNPVNKVIDENSDIYNKYEVSGIDKDLLKDNENNITKYEKAKKVLKTTDIKYKVKLRKNIQDNKNNIEKLEQTENNINMENNQISDSYSDYQKYEDIDTNKLYQLKKELLCNLKAEDELRNAFIHNNDKKIKDFCEDKIKQIDMSIENLNKEINTIGIMDKSEIDDKIDYMKQKLTDEKRYLQENHSLNDSHKENEIKEITKGALEKINPSIFKALKAINELYTIENKVVEVQKEIELTQDGIKLQKEGKTVETTKEKLKKVADWFVMK